MIKLLTVGRIFGDTRCHMYTIEWQKRGLPHVHILLWLEEKMRPESIDQIICAELPDPDINPDLYQIIKTTMVHGPCGSFNLKSPCVINGSDQASFTVQDLDEVTNYQAGRYISSSEAVWRIFRFPIHDRFPSVMHLAVHLENCQRIYFTEQDVVDKVINPKKTTLMAFLELCQVDDFAKTLLHVEVPAYYVWKNNRFDRRKKGKVVSGYLGVKKDQVLGRVYTVHPGNTEWYHLRLLLHEIRGPTSFSTLKTVDGVIHPTFQAACRALGLLEDDANWCRTLDEACISDSPYKIRELFAIMLVFCHVDDPPKLWEKYRDYFSEHIKREVERDGGNVELLLDVIYNKCLILLEDIVISMSGKTLLQFGLHSPIRDERFIVTNRQYLRELAYDTVYLTKVVAENVPKLNLEQKKVYNEILNSIISDSGQLYFLDAPGGTGKTFLINLLLAKIRSEKNIAIAVASSGVAATLIDGGKTAHSAFKLPLNLGYSESPLCNISKQSDMAHVLREAKIIIWDECTMAHKNGIEALNRLLQDIRGCDRIMGGVIVLLAGDFRQTLPVVPRGTRADEVKACIKSSILWPSVKVLSLTINMRVHLQPNSKAEEFSKILIDIDDGEIPEEDGRINVSYINCETVPDLITLTDKIYPNIDKAGDNCSSWLKERAILTPTNEQVNCINNFLLEKLPTEQVRYESVDKVLEDEEAVHYPVEFLHTLNPPGIPPHVLQLKIGTPIMLLRNLNPPKLCNGTRLQVKVLHKNVIEAMIFTGKYEGETVFIPRIPLIPSDYHFEFKRLQFPVKVSYAMTINKAQGQSLKMTGVDLRNDCFSHGQLYVACSRVYCKAKTMNNVFFGF
ncbi:uncharacterized protein LOC123264012 [Cotesia glomerata]|uniref:uncharacterized protein LOC123264012 n=1 Tax=Cotesia glomerata TaxID=32391 RepID=UPI001D03168D|nr:uncharacterized protein LOC123264012 [Cotesia glomerata]